MDTNSSENKKWIKSAEISYAENRDYGTSLNLSRADWRARCLKMLYSGKDEFEKWQKEILLKSVGNNHTSSYRTVVSYEDGSKQDINRLGSSYLLDYAGHKFDEHVNAHNYEFLLEASFDGARFEQGAEFTNAIFHKTVSFNHAEFIDGVWFRKAKFSIGAEFKSAVFPTFSFFNQAEFNGWCEFNSAYFGGSVIFEGVIFNSIGHFEGAIYKKMPSYRGCQIDSTRLEFSDNSDFPKNDSEDGAIESVSFLKRLSDEHGQTDQALRFNAIELRLKRQKPNADFGFKIVTWLYEKLSDYGRSFAKPMLWYGVLICLTTLFAMMYSTYSDSPIEEQQVLCKPIKDQPPPLKLTYGRAVVEYAMFRAGGLMDFTDTGKQNNAVNCRLFEEPIEPPLMRAWGIFKGIASITLLFLAALGLRNKYRIK